MARLRDRLAKLEHSQGDDNLSAGASRLLVELLARWHAMWWPFREHTGTFRAELRRVQVEYWAGVGGLTARGSGESNWKSAHLGRNELITSGRCVALESGGQVVGLRLTPQGIADAGALIGDRIKLASCELSQLLLAVLRDFEGCDHSGRWMIENSLFGGDVVNSSNPKDWEYMVDYVLPLIADGAVETTSDLWNRAYFRFRHDDITAIPSPATTEQAWCDDVYLSAYDGERAAIQRWECLGGGIFVPMRCT